VHPVWKRSRPNDENDPHCGWPFAEPNEVVPHIGEGLSTHAFDDTSMSPFHPEAKCMRDIYETMQRENNNLFSVPVLFDTKTNKIVNNESTEIVRMLNSEFDAFASNKVNLEPEALKQEIADLDAWIYNDICNGVYKCGFCSTQVAYNEAVANLFKSLDRVEDLLSDGRKYLCGEELTSIDSRLFCCLIRFDEVYVVYFKCNKKQIAEYPNIMKWMKNLWTIEAFKKTTKMDHIKTHYFSSHAKFNFFGIIPHGPDFIAKLEQ
jgi:putative glutathione S-transferase